jgi:hypothetical protein
MYEDSSDFTWSIPITEQALAWRDCRTSISSSSTERALVQTPGAEFKLYKPLQGTAAIYRELANTEPTESGILSFVSRYGRLGPGAEGYAQVLAATGEPEQTSSTAEPLNNWKPHISCLFEAVRLWDLIQVGDTGTLSKTIKWKGDGVFRYERPLAVSKRFGQRPWRELREEHGDLVAGQDILAESGADPGFRSKMTRRSVAIAGILFVQNLVNFGLYTNNGPFLVWHAGRNRTLLQDTPRSLLGAIYLQFAQAIHGGRKPRRCHVCGRWFDLAPGLNRKDRETCSGTCRTRAYRERQEEARLLREQGRSLKVIAKQLETNVKTVEKWVASQGE